MILLIPNAIQAQYIPFVIIQIIAIIIVIKQLIQVTKTLSFTFHNQVKIWELNEAKRLNTKNIHAYDNSFHESKYFSQNKAVDSSGPTTISRVEKLIAIIEK